MLESQIERKVSLYAKQRGVLTYKFVSPSNRGVPDRVFLYRGQTLFVEFKQPGKKPTALQAREHERLTAAGHKVHVVTDAAGGIDLVARFAHAACL